MPQVNVTGIVLKCYDLGEKDRILVLLTAENGKIRVVAKGAKRPGSRFAAAASPLMELSANIYLGRGLHTLTQVEISTSHRALREQLDRLAFGLFMAELIDLSTVDDEPQPEYCQLLSDGLTELESGIPEQLLSLFEVQLLEIAGLLPALRHCANCQAEDRPLVALSATAGGLVCDRCSHTPGVLALSEAAVELLRYLAARTWEDYKQANGWSGAALLTKALEQFLFYQLEARPKSYEFLNSMRAVQ